jgi:GNAT superfamily N-acetyltransferase
MAPATSAIRPATARDLPELLALGRRFHAESVYHSLPFDEPRVARRIGDYLESSVRCLFVATHEDRLVGMLGGFLDRYFFCDAKLAYDAFFYIVPPHRDGRLAAALVERLRAWAEAAGAHELCFGVSSGINDQRVGRYYEHLGFQRAGALYRLWLAPEDS